MEHNFYKRYVVRFVLICLGLFIVSSFLPTPGIFNILLSMGTAFFVGRKFAADYGRAPTSPEQNKFAGIGFIALVGVVGLLTAFLLSVMPPEDKAMWMSQFQGKPISVMIVGTAIAVSMLWGSIHFGFGLGARLYIKKLNKGAR